MKRRPMEAPMQARPSPGIPHVKSDPHQLPSSPEGRVLKPAGSNLSQEEIVAEERLKRAENKISGLLEELEELKFFHELESETPSATTPKTPKSSQRSITPRKLPPQQLQQLQQPTLTSQPRPLSRGRDGRDVSDRTAGIPLNIRALSPARAGRLPPPPPANGAPTPRSMPIHTPRAQHMLSTGHMGGLETYKPMSPRSIAKLDRNSLELECQTLVRKLQIIEQERNSKAAMVEMYEISLQDHDTDKAKIQKLQGELGKVSSELKRQLQSITKGKESLMKEYEEKLQQNISKLHRVQEKADSYKMDLDVTQEEAKRAKQEAENLRITAKEEKARAEELKTREGVLEMQLKEARNLNATLVKKVEQKRSEVSTLQSDLTQTSQQLRDNLLERDAQYESKIDALQNQLDQSKDKYTRLEQAFRDRDEQATDHEKRLDVAQVKEAEQTALIEELQIRIKELEHETVAKYEEGKKASKSQETKKMQELVAERANQTRESERRIKAMQEQLRHQADRHHAEIQETRRRNDERLEAMRDEIREELRLHEGEKLLKLETELSATRRTYEEAKLDYSTRLKEAQQKSRDAAADFQRQDEIRQKELDHMHERLDKYSAELSAKDSDISELNRRLDELRMTLETMEAAKTQSIAECMKKDDLLEEEKEKMADREMEFNVQMDAVKADFAELEHRLRNENHKLQEQLDDVYKKLIDAQAAAKEGMVVKEKMGQLQKVLEAAESSLQAEKSRHEQLESELQVELAKMEGKLRASESSLKTKKARVQELEKQLDIATSSKSKMGEEKQTEIEALRRRLEETAATLDSESQRRQEKEILLVQTKTEVSSLQEKVKNMCKVEDTVRDLKRKAAQIEYQLSQKDSELTQTTKAYDETRSKLFDTEQQYAIVKADLESQVEKKEKLIERYEKSIKDIEIKLEKEHNTNVELEMAKSDLKRNVESLEREKIRKETELTNLRKDYEDLSSLLEDNLHSSAKKDDLDIQHKRREREMRETVDLYKQNVDVLEGKLSQSETAKEELLSQLKKLQGSLDDLNDEKLKLRSEMSSLRQKYDTVSFELDSLRQHEQQSKGGVDAEIGRKDRHMREAIQRYTRTIADLESKLEEELQTKTEFEDRLASARSELEDKQQQTQELIQKHSKAARKLESDLNQSYVEKQELKARLDQTNKDLEQKRKELKQAMSKFSSEVTELNNVKQEHDEYRQMSESTREELERKTKQIDELKQQIPQLQTELQIKNRECEESNAQARRYETELNKRKDQITEIVKRYTDQIAMLESQLDEHTMARSSTENRVESVRAEAKSKESKIRELQDAVAELETKLEIAQKNKDSAKLKADTLVMELDAKESDARKFEMEKIELETKLHAQMRSKEELRSKVSDLSSKLERKEREVREVTDRYKIYVMELESKLDQDADAKHQMQLDIDRLKNDLTSAVEVSSDASELRQKLYVLETEVENYRSKSRDTEFKSKETIRTLESKLSDATKTRDEIEEVLKKTQGEKAEVIAALEGVINEVQNREDEIESLSELLHRRDEELQHAKIIATKALQSAKEIQKRFKDRDKTQQSELMQRMDELSDNVETLSSKNETFQRKIAMLERDLRDKNLECKRLKEQLRQMDGGIFRDSRDPMKDDGSAFTHSTHISSRGEGSRGLQISTGQMMDPDGIGLGSDSFSPTGPHSPMQEFGDENMFSKEVEFPGFEQKPSRDMSEDGAGSSTIMTTDIGNKWSQDFESDNRSTGFDSVGSEPTGKSRRSIERDALRKYVRQRYMSKR